MKRSKVKIGGFFSPTFNLCILTFALLPLSSPSHALTFPDSAELKKTHRVVARKDGRPVHFSRILDGDSMSVVLEWKGGRPVSARHEQEDPYGDEAFAALAADYGAGAAWHEFDDGKRPFEGLQQQWYLKGYGKESGWLGSGLHRGRHFLVFREEPPGGMARVEAPLALRPGVAAFLDSSSLWLAIPCKDADWPAPAALPGEPARKAPKGKPICYRSNEDSRLAVRVLRKAPLLLEARLEEGESPALREIRRVIQTVPDAAQAEYAADLSQMLLSEGQMFLARMGQSLPALFNWPPWQLQGSKEGKVPPARFLELVRREEEPADHLPALRLEARKLRLAINLYYKGAFQLEAEERK